MNAQLEDIPNEQLMNIDGGAILDKVAVGLVTGAAILGGAAVLGPVGVIIGVSAAIGGGIQFARA